MAVAMHHRSLPGAACSDAAHSKAATSASFLPRFCPPTSRSSNNPCTSALDQRCGALKTAAAPRITACSSTTSRRMCAVRAVNELHGHPGEVTVVVGDIGGTNARLSLWEFRGPRDSIELFAKTYPTESSPTFEGVLDIFLNEAAVTMHPRPRAAALAIAGYVEDNRCEMTNISWVVDAAELQHKFGFSVALMNDFEAVGYGIPAMGHGDVVYLNDIKPKDKAPKIVMGPGTGLGAAQLMWDEGQCDYKVWPGEGAHATFAPRGWKQAALAMYASNKVHGFVEIEQVACGNGLELIYEFLLNDEPCNRQGLQLGARYRKRAQDITSGALRGDDPLAAEAVDMLMAIVGAEAGAMALRCMAKGGVYIAGGITPRLLPRLRASPSGGGALLEGFLAKGGRKRFADILETMPLAVVTNGKVGQIGALRVAEKLLQQQ